MVSDTRGFMFPRTATGRSSLVPPPPWHYSGSMLTIEFRTSPDAVAELLPAPLTPAEEDPGAVAVIWADWQSCSDTFEELLDPVRAQYMETFVVVRCGYAGQTYSRCVYIWVDKDFAMVRGYHQGYPKKLGSLHVTRPVTVGVAGPRLEPGGRFGATCSAYGRRLIESTFTITGTAPTAGFVNGHPMIHHRVFPAIESDGTDSLHELVTHAGLRRGGRPLLRRRRDDHLLRVAGRGADALGAGGDDRRVLAGGRHELAVRDDARASEPAMTGPAPDGDLGPDDADIADPDTYVAGVPHATFLRLRRSDPVSWWGEDHAGGRGFWAVARHGDLLTVSRDVGRFSSASGIRLEEMDEEETEARRTMMELDPPEHTAYRRLVSKPFSRREVYAYETAIRQLARSVVSTMAAAAAVAARDARLRRPGRQAVAHADAGRAARRAGVGWAVVGRAG